MSKSNSVQSIITHQLTFGCSFHVNISIDAMAYNKGWASIAGKAK